MARDYVVTARVGPKVERARFPELTGALDSIESRGKALERHAEVSPVQPKLMRRFDSVQQVVARLELAGPGGLRAGVDVRGDGSAEGYTGRVRRRVVEQRAGETPYDALRRAVVEA